MEAQNSNPNRSAGMAFSIDLNETPIASPREAGNDAVSGSANVSICTVCRKGVPVGRRAKKETLVQLQEFKCFRCLLKSDGGGSSSGGGGRGVELGRFDINASPPREAQGEDVAVAAGRSGNGGAKTQASVHSAFSGHRATTRQLNPVLEDIRHNLPSSVATHSANFRFQDMLQQRVRPDSNIGIALRDSGFGGATLRSSHATPSKTSPGSPNMVYLQTLREYIAESSGVLGEGWVVEFEFCDKRYKTSAVYIAPDGSRLKSMEDVARHLGLPSESGSNRFSFTQKPGFLGSGIRQDGIHDGFPIQFQDFCLISAGNIDWRPSYHNSNQIWPIGYRCSWHDRITGSLFVCDIADGGDSGPIFKVRRYPCIVQPIPVGSTILSKTAPVSSKGDDNVRKDNSATSQAVDDDSMSTITLLNEDSPPCLETCFSTSKRDDELPQEYNSSNPDSECLPQRTGNSIGDIVGITDVIGEFQVEGRSTSSVWEMVSQAFLYACHETYKQKGAIKFYCGHDVHGINNENLDKIESLSRYCYFDGLISIPHLVQNEKEFNMTCEMLLIWLNQDRFGLEADFVQEIIEQLPGVAACSEYKNLNDRKQNSGLQTVGCGFFQADRMTNNASGTSKRDHLKSVEAEDILKRGPCPLGKPLSSSLPSYLLGDALQVWELAWRFLDVLGLGQPFSFQELESELVSPWSDGYPFNSVHGTVDIGDSAPRIEKDSQARFNGLLLAKILGSLLKLLVSELLSKAAAYVCPNFDGGESKSRRGKRKDLDCLAALKKIKLDMLPVNGLTWHEIARRYILAVLSMEGNLDSTEIAGRESGKVFHCLRGDGGILCDSLTGVAALEGDAVILQDAMKEIFGSLKSKNEIVTVFEGESDDKCAPTVEVNDGVIPEWAQVLEPVRKLPTNVGARIRRCINEALEKNPPEWAKKILEHSISKEVYKGNASGPTKRAVISVLASVTPEKPQQKAEKKEKVKVKTNVTDLITKQCRIVLRRAAAADEDRVFCNLLGRIILKPNDNDDEGLLGYPAMVSRPLDFRTIDLRLAAGAYGGSHEAFIDDVREVWRNIRTAYGDRSDLIDVAESLSQKFEDLYEKEVLAIVHKIDEISNANDSSADALKERDDLLADVGKSSLPRAPWEEGICKVCGMDKDDDNVLLCDKCDSEYHRYCLNPPLLRIPEGNWYCPSCVAGHSISFLSVANQSRKRRYQGKFTRKFLEELARLANLMEMKEYWEFTVEERVFFMKFLFDEALNSATIRDHMDQSATRAADLQQKLKSLTSELKLLKVKEEMFGLSAEKANSGVCNIRGDLKSDASSAVLNTESSSRGKSSEKGSHLLPFSGFTKPEDGPSINEQVDYNRQPFWPPSSSTSAADTFSQSQHENIVAHAQLSRNDIFAHGQHLGTIKNDISNLQDSIASIELELLKVSLRKDFLGRDANGRVYWAFHCRGARPWIIANGSLESKQKLREEFASVPGSDNWMYYESYDEIEKLVGWLKENNVRERELKESISQLLSNKLKDSEYTEKHILSKGGSNPSIFSIGRKALLPDFLSTKAMAALEKRFGPRQQIYRCECLELLWPYNDHCPSCHQNFPTNEELKEHSKENCKAATSVSKKRQTTEDVSKSKKLRNVASQENRIGNMGDLHILMSEKQKDEVGFSERYQKPDCPFKFEDIMARFVVPSSVKDAVNGIGLIGNGGIPSFLPRGPHYISDPALSLGPTRINESGSTGMPTDFIRQQQHGKGPSAVDRMMDNTVSNRLSRSGEKGLAEGPSVERLRSILTSERGRVKDKSSLLGLSRSSIVRESSLRPLLGRASEVLRFLKINLLDMDAALPEDALRMSRSNQERRCLWRAFVKSAKSIYEMIQATIILEDAIKTEYLTNDWWYWSSPSTAAKITTLSALALRLYALDSAISYEKPLPSTTTEILEPNCAIDEDLPLANPSSPQLQKTPEPENPRTRSRTSKRRKDMNS